MMEWYVVTLGVIIYMMIGIIIFAKLIPTYCEYTAVRTFAVTSWPIFLLVASIIAIVRFLHKGLPENW